LTAFAHGEEVLITVFLEFIVFVVFIVGLVTINLNGRGKLIICGIFILATTLTFIFIDRLPYYQYRTAVNVVVVVVPLAIVTIGYIGLRHRFQK
jgi:hypothetical protein